MREANIVINHYFRNKERFADLFNGTFFLGKQVVKADELEEGAQVYQQTRAILDRAVGQNMECDAGRDTLERERDVKMFHKDGKAIRLLAVEIQRDVDYSMPFRCMQYDTMEYQYQVEDIKQKNNQKRENGKKYGRKLKKSDKLQPVYTVCVYYGTKKWSGPRSLREMMEFGEDKERISEAFGDYPFRLYCLNEMTDFSVFQTALRKVFEVLRCRTKKEDLLNVMRKDTEYRNVDEETLEVLAVLMNEPRIWEQRNRYLQKEECGGGYDMCKAWDDIKKDERKEGIKEGRIEGALETLCGLVKDGLLKMEEAAKRAGMTTEVFRDKMKERLMS